MSAKEEFDEAMNMLDVYEHLSEVHIKAVKAYVSELQAENERLNSAFQAIEQSHTKKEEENERLGKERDDWKNRAVESAQDALNSIIELRKLRAWIEGSPIITARKAEYCPPLPESWPEKLLVYAVPVEADEK